MINKKTTYFFLFIVFCFLFPSYIFAQYWEFGQNKVQYKNFDWKVIDTETGTNENFSLLYYTGGEELAKFGYNVISKSHKRLSDCFNYSPEGRTPVVIYKSHNDFEQTNITLAVFDENLGGFTEPYKNRVVVPFDGSYEDFRHVLSHEFTHAFQFNVLRGGGFTSTLVLTLSQMPLWFMEGMAEYFSLGWDAQSDMFVRDALYWDRIRPVNRLYEIEGSFLMYKEGQSILYFIANRYGEKKIGEIFRKMKGVGNIGGALEAALGIDEEELNRLWIQDLKFRYWSEAAGKLPAPDYARQLTDRNDDYAFNTAPAISPDGSEIVFLSDRNDYESLYLMSTIDGRVKDKLLDGGKTQAYESFHIMQGGISWSPDNKKIAFVVKTKGRDEICIMNPHTHKQLKKLKPELDRIFSPSFSPDGKKLAIRGVKDGAADIYLIDVKTGELEQLTDDMYDDIMPSWTPDSNNIIFSSDRPYEDSVWKYGYYAIFRIDVSGNNIQKIPIPMPRTSYIASPLYVNGDSAGDACILFVSNHTGINNIFIFKPNSQQLLQLTDVIGGTFTPSISDDGKYLAFSLYSKGGWDIYTIKSPVSKASTPGQSKTFSSQYSDFSEDTTSLPEGKKLGLRLSPDWGGAAVSYSTDGSYRGYLQFVISDWLGNHQFYMATSSPENLLANFRLEYLYLPHRLDFGAVAVKESYYYYDTYDPNHWGDIENYGGAALLQYPLDKFRRIEMEWQLMLMQQYEYYRDKRLWSEWYYITGPVLSFVLDNSVWGATGPQNGERRKFSILSNLPFEINYSPTIAFNYYSLDCRKYWKIVRNYSFAVRAMNAGLWGRDWELAGPLSVSGPDSLRGYDPYEVAGKNIGLLNFEFRYPFIEQIKITFPIPLILGGIRGATFLDLGYAKDDPTTLRLFSNGALEDLKMGFGTGMRMRVSEYFILKFDAAWHTDLINTSKVHWRFSFAPEF